MGIAAGAATENPAVAIGEKVAAAAAAKEIQNIRLQNLIVPVGPPVTGPVYGLVGC